MSPISTLSELESSAPQCGGRDTVAETIREICFGYGSGSQQGRSHHINNSDAGICSQGYAIRRRPFSYYPERSANNATATETSYSSSPFPSSALFTEAEILSLWREEAARSSAVSRGDGNNNHQAQDQDSTAESGSDSRGAGWAGQNPFSAEALAARDRRKLAQRKRKRAVFDDDDDDVAPDIFVTKRNKRVRVRRSARLAAKKHAAAHPPAAVARPCSSSCGTLPARCSPVEAGPDAEERKVDGVVVETLAQALGVSSHASSARGKDGHVKVYDYLAWREHSVMGRPLATLPVLAGFSSATSEVGGGCVSSTVVLPCGHVVAFEMLISGIMAGWLQTCPIPGCGMGLWYRGCGCHFFLSREETVFFPAAENHDLGEEEVVRMWYLNGVVGLWDGDVFDVPAVLAAGRAGEAPRYCWDCERWEVLGWAVKYAEGVVGRLGTHDRAEKIVREVLRQYWTLRRDTPRFW